MINLDTETCGLHGPVVLLQYAENDDPVTLHHVWHESIRDTLEIYEKICNNEVCGFNLAFDWFHLCQSYTTLQLLGEKVGYSESPIDHINTYAECEPLARDGPCLKPKGALDLLLYARKGPYQSTMDRKNIVIKKIPIQLADHVCDVLETRVQLKDIYFAKRGQNNQRRWAIRPIKGSKDFVDLVLKFSASSALKVLVRDALGVKAEDVLLFSDVGVPKKLNPIEVGWAPFALALSSASKGWYTETKVKGQKKKGLTWPGVIERHIDHWSYNKLAQKYGTLDVEYVQRLRHHFEISCPDNPPTANDTDSILACMVGAVRWRGYSIDGEKLNKLIAKAKIESEAAPKAPHHVAKYLAPFLSPAEREAIAKKVQLKEGEETSTKKVVLEAIAKLGETDCSKCCGLGIIDNVKCTNCKDGGVPHPAAERAQKCLSARQAKTKLSNLNKLRIAGRFHVSTNVIGALSGRMSGRDGLNATGIQHEKEIRSLFTLAWPGDVLCGGDFVSFEVSIADARYDDPKLRQQLLTCWFCEHSRQLFQYEQLCCPNCGGAQDTCKECKAPIVLKEDGTVLKSFCKCTDAELKGQREDTLRKIHGLFAMGLYPGEDYTTILMTKGSSDDHYDKGKRGLFSQLYGGNYSTIMVRLGVDEEQARGAELWFGSEFEGVGRARQDIAERFCSMVQPGGIGSQVIWNEPDEYVVSLNGFKRYFTLENQICRVLFDLANDPPEEWSKIKLKCVRRDREQKIGGAVRSAIFAAAFNIQSKNMRAAANHEIQATGSKETKDLQRDIWELQPVGVNVWIVQPFQVHDEVMCPTKPEFVDREQEIVSAFVDRRKSLIPLLRIDWSKKLNNWSEK